MGGLVGVLAHQSQMYLDQLFGMQPGTSEDLLVKLIVCAAVQIVPKLLLR